MKMPSFGDKKPKKQGTFFLPSYVLLCAIWLSTKKQKVVRSSGKGPDGEKKPAKVWWGGTDVERQANMEACKDAVKELHDALISHGEENLEKGKDKAAHRKRMVDVSPDVLLTPDGITSLAQWMETVRRRCKAGVYTEEVFDPHYKSAGFLFRGHFLLLMEIGFDFDPTGAKHKTPAKKGNERSFESQNKWEGAALLETGNELYDLVYDPPKKSPSKSATKKGKKSGAKKGKK